ncbi:MAG: hypothetical protein AAGB16_01635 [Pseudomonadota bacterium]
MKPLALSLFIAPLLALPGFAGEVPPLAQEDLDILIGDDWTGSLTYLNYGEPVKDFTIPAEIDIERTEGGLNLSYQYPDEPHQNASMVSKVSADGARLNGETITSNTLLETGAREIRTAYPCEDMGRKASCEMIYTLSATSFETRKLVTYQGETEAFRRNAYSFSR